MKNIFSRFLFVLCWVALTGLVRADDTEFNYRGVLNTSGSPYNGTADFYFAILTVDSSLVESVQWTNDGGDLDVVPPANPVSLQVNQGRFAVQIGDTSLANMTELPASIFNSADDLYLRVWVDAAGGGLEQLSPDRKISLPDAIGIQSRKSLTIYVDPVIGNDRYPGHRANKPKKTIQAAVDVLPKVITDETIIHLAAGTYDQGATLKNLILSGPSSKLLIVGDIDNPSSVVLDGGGTEKDGLYINSIATTIRIEGLTIQNFEHSLRVASSNLVVKDCVFKGSDFGILARYNSVFTTTDVEIDDCLYGINAATNVYLRMENTSITNCANEGVHVKAMSSFYLVGTTLFENCGVGTGSAAFRLSGNSFGNLDGAITLRNSGGTALHCIRGSYVNIGTSGTTLVVEGNNVGLWADLSSTIDYEPSLTTFLSNTQDTQATNNGFVF
ncbi:MAG: right-handed parallel beta-helix repeat-containing protein [Sumerlaeia bacterium]